MIIEAIALGYLAGDYIYHRWIAHDDPPPNPNQTVSVPTSQPGTAIPMIYGRVLVKGMAVYWAGHASFVTGASLGVGSQYVYGLDMHFVVGIFPQDGSSVFRFLWNGSKRLGLGPGATIPFVTYTVDNSTDPTSGGDAGFIGGTLEVHPGDPAQDLTASSLGGRMLAAGVPSTQISSQRGVLGIFLTGPSSAPWFIGGSPNPGTYAVECDALPPLVVGGSGARFGHGLIGLDLNPVDVILDLLTGGLGKLGQDPALLDMASFDAAAVTLDNEGHGFSRSWEDSSDAKTRLNEVLAQIDGVLREDSVTGVTSIKLIRADFDPSDVLEITPANCVELQNFVAGGWDGLPNDVYVSFTDRTNNYGQGTGRSQNQANANGGEVVAVTLSYLGISNQELADAVADRELQARSRPIAKGRAIVDRSFVRVLQGDAVKLTWPEANIAGVIFRVANVNKGTLENPYVALDLLQDYFYTHRNVVHPPEETGGGGVFGESL